MITTVEPVTTRPATGADVGFLLALLVSSLPPATAALGAVPGLLEQQHAAREASYAAAYASLRDEIVLVGDEPVGRLLTADVPFATHVVDIAIAPGRRGRGWGTHLLERLLAHGPVSLTVATDSPAGALYERLGFCVVGRTDTHLSLHHSGHHTTEGTGA
ncbi:GNAT family N-acetyltransferase [Nocardioides currus]|uniref:GNAT family N-acetyltransferase n=1 Tax=Nocardioides currus TaxID=2133958 RepID=A0A2R7YYJ1_9ACTN|nr:GNAT family N-acetyltransferase [Nocardioides currus]PUA81374.1 GNAT family N-acetyltransferase [Nocardioides currus]